MPVFGDCQACLNIQRAVGQAGQSVATVNGIDISHQEYNRVTNIQQEFLRRLRTQYGQYADLFIQAMGLNADPKALALDILIREALINEAADALHINITPGYIESQIGTIRKLFNDNLLRYCHLMYLMKPAMLILPPSVSI